MAKSTANLLEQERLQLAHERQQLAIERSELAKERDYLRKERERLEKLHAAKSSAAVESPLQGNQPQKDAERQQQKQRSDSSRTIHGSTTGEEEIYEYIAEKDVGAIVGVPKKTPASNIDWKQKHQTLARMDPVEEHTAYSSADDTGFHSDDSANNARRLLESNSNANTTKRTKKLQQRKLTKNDISLPSNFRHKVHIGWDPNKEFQVTVNDSEDLDMSIKAVQLAIIDVAVHQQPKKQESKPAKRPPPPPLAMPSLTAVQEVKKSLQPVAVTAANARRVPAPPSRPPMPKREPSCEFKLPHAIPSTSEQSAGLRAAAPTPPRKPLRMPRTVTENSSVSSSHGE